jgi:cytochrome c biogenesis protein CcdA
MKPTNHGFAFNFVFCVLLVAITGIIGGVIFTATQTGIMAQGNASGVVLVMGAAIILLALLTAIGYMVGRLDTQIQRERRDEQPQRRRA